MNRIRSAFTLLEAMIAIAILAAVMAGVFSTLSSGVQLKDSVQKLDASTDVTARALNNVIRDLRFADVNKIYLDGTAWATTSAAGDDLYSFKTCTGFTVTNGAAIASLDRVMQYSQGVILRFHPNGDGSATLYRKVISLDPVTAVQTGVLLPEVAIANNLVWQYTPTGASTPVHGFTIVQPNNIQTAVIGNRLAVRVATYTGAEAGGIKAYRETDSAVYLRCSQFTGSGASAPSITSATAVTAYVGTAFIYDITALYDPTRYTAASLPDGLSCDVYTGRISGTPTTQGTYTAVIHASNDEGSDTKNVTITVVGPIPVITSDQALNAQVNAAISYQIVATNSPTSYAATNLLSGLTLSSSTGKITGTVSSATSKTAMLTATNASGTSLAVPLLISVTAAPPPAPAITSALTATATAGSPFTYQITASNTPTSFSATGLPSGMSCSSTGLISGTTTSYGTSIVTISATNITGTGSASLSLQVQAPIPVITSVGTASAAVGTAFNYQITATNSPTSYQVSGQPTWMSLNTTTGLLFGNPSGSTATYNLSIGAINSYGTGSGTVVLSVTGMAAPTLTLPNPLNATVGSLFSYTPSATPSVTSYTVSGLPSTITMASTSSGAISGTPTVANTYTVTFTATNAASTTTASTTLVVAAAPTPPIVTLGNRTGNGSDFQYLGTVTAGTGQSLYLPSFSWTYNSGCLSKNNSSITIKRGWISTEASGTSLTSSQFLIIGNLLTSPITLSATISDTTGQTTTTSRTY